MGLKKLTVREVLPVLEKVEQRSDNEWKALCPAHSDKKSSLSIKESPDGIAVCHCFAGCSQADIWNAFYSRLGVSPTYEEEKPIKANKQQKKVVARYDYINESGEIVNTKVRYSTKDFYWTKKGLKTPLPLFNLKSVIDNELIFLVEGEKDVLTLKKLGFTATNSKDGLTLDNAKEYLSGKEVIIIPDNDEAGKKYAIEAGNLLSGIAKSIKMVDLRSVWTEVPPKGDITDYIEHGLKMDQIIKEADSLEEYQITKKESQERTEPSTHPHFKIWSEIDGYSLNSKNQIVSIKGDTTTPLCTGSIIITEVIYKNDGLNDDIEFKCEGITDTGEKLPEVFIPVDEFDSLKWISKKWGCKIVTLGAQSTNQKLISGIKLTGKKADITYKNCHTGYVNKNGKPIAYLHAGGSIGDQGIICELDDVLHQYKLSGCSTTEEEQKEAFISSLALLRAHRESVVYPLLSFIYLAPLSQINKEVNGECGFCLYLRGKTQNGKSTLSALAMSHFGEFTSTTPPTSFESTSNRNEALSHFLKDSVLWIDDFHPKGNKKERENQNEQFNRIARASGDRASRGRLNSNSELKRSYIPRCLFLVTGEDDPQLSQSGFARIFTLDVKTERKDLSKLFQASRIGLLSRAMSDYISYIINNYDEVKKHFSKRYEFYISFTRKALGENRLSIQSALLMTSMDLLLAYAIKNSLLDKNTATEILEKNARQIMGIAHKNDEEIKSSDPVEKFISTLSTMISNKEVEVRECKYGSETNELYNTYPPRIGWLDEEFYYLDKDKTYGAVKEKLESVDDSIGATIKGLYRDLLDQGKIIGDNSNNPTKLKNINGKPKRLIFFKRSVLDVRENSNN